MGVERVGFRGGFWLFFSSVIEENIGLRITALF